jgi:hypothetical protein
MDAIRQISAFRSHSKSGTVLYSISTYDTFCERSTYADIKKKKKKKKRTKLNHHMEQLHDSYRKGTAPEPETE